MPIIKVFTWRFSLILILCSLALSSCEFENPWMKEILNFRTVSFNTNGGGYIPSQDLIMDETVKRPPDPSKAGFVFSGWYTDNDTFESLWDFDTAPDGYMTLHAKWDIFVPAVKTFTVTFNTNGGGSAVDPITVESGSVINKPADPTKTGYDSNFTGWYEQNRTNAFDFNTPITADITLYAKWRPYELGEIGPGGGKIFYRNEAGFTVTFDDSTAHYLEAAPANMSTRYQWALLNTDIQGTEKEIGTGRKNTSLIVAKIGSSAPAAHECYEYSYNNKYDWFLPSINELEQFYINRDYVGNEDGLYWSSTQYGESVAWLFEIHFYGNIASIDDKVFNGDVRAVRAF